MLIGQLVTLRSSQGDIVRTVVRDMGEIVLVCRTEEYERAKLEGREPAAIGFKRSDII